MIYEHKVQYYETDKMQIVHHSNYVRWLEEARVEFLERVGASFVMLEDMGIVSPVTDVSCKYVGMMRFGDTAKITATLKEFNGVKMRVSYVIENAQTGEICCNAESGHCFMQGGKIINMRKKYPEIYERFFTENV
jgi:acyl-CoA thioester hydrolase